LNPIYSVKYIALHLFQKLGEFPAVWSGCLDAFALHAFVIVKGENFLTESGNHVIYCDEIQRPNQPMKPTAPWRSNFSVFATITCRGLSLSR
jgi:hypothetical protein